MQGKDMVELGRPVRRDHRGRATALCRTYALDQADNHRRLPCRSLTIAVLLKPVSQLSCSRYSLTALLQAFVLLCIPF